jgi:hypothetical protein
LLGSHAELVFARDFRGTVGNDELASTFKTAEHLCVFLIARGEH